MKKHIKGSNEDKQRIYQELVLIRRSRSKEEFRTMLQTSISQSLKSQEQFLDYFMRYYYNRQEMWAVCYRNEELPDTNAHVESFQRVLKHVEFAGKRNRRVAVLLEALLRLEKDYFIKWHS